MYEIDKEVCRMENCLNPDPLNKTMNQILIQKNPDQDNAQNQQKIKLKIESNQLRLEILMYHGKMQTQCILQNENEIHEHQKKVKNLQEQQKAQDREKILLENRERLNKEKDQRLLKDSKIQEELNKIQQEFLTNNNN